MLGQIPEGPIWAVAVLLAMLLKDAIKALVQRRSGNNEGYGGRIASLELSRGERTKLPERMASIEQAVKLLNGGSTREFVQRLATIEAHVEENSREIMRLRDWKHDELQQQLQSWEARLANVELDKGIRP